MPSLQGPFLKRTIFYNDGKVQILVEQTLAEARGLRPAIVTMKRGTIIHADHARMLGGIRHYLAVGIGPGSFLSGGCQKGEHRKSPIRLARDFYAPPTWDVDPERITEVLDLALA